jgi:GDP-L-fucose synthase
MAAACILVMNLDRDVYQHYTDPMCGHINVGFGSDISISELADFIKATVGFEGELVFDATKPDGSPRKLMDSSLLNALGWTPEIGLREGLERAYEDFQKQINSNSQGR